MAWLTRDGDVLATLELAETRGTRLRGLRGRDGMEGCLLLRPARACHTVGAPFPIDVAWCRPDLVVIAVATLRPFRVGLPRMGAGCVLAARAGAFERWGLRPGDQLEVKG